LTAVALPPLEEKKEFVQEKFASVTPKYDLLNSVLSLYIDHLWRIKTAKALKDQDGPVLDVCAGTLPLSLAILKQGKRPVVALDFCFDMLKYGMERLGANSRGAANILPVCADGEVLPLPDSTFGGVTVAFGVRNLADVPRGFREMFRILRPGGIAAILEFSRPRNPVFAPLYRFYLHRILPNIAGIISGDKEAYKYLAESIEGFYSQQAVCSMMQDAGFESVTYRPMTLGIVTLYTGNRPRLI